MASNRQPVARGGLWSTTQAPVSKETQQLLKVMMEESKLTNFQRRQLQESMKKGESLPTNVNPKSSRTPLRQQAANRKPPPKVMNARHLSGGKRRKDAIDEQKAKQGTDAFVPASGKYISERDKRKLQNVMAYGEHGKDIDDDKPKRRSVPQESRAEPDIDRFDEVLQEIEERREFLGEMESLGKGKEYRTLIETQISQKIRELELIDKSRSGELRTALEEQEDAP